MNGILHVDLSLHYHDQTTELLSSQYNIRAALQLVLESSFSIGLTSFNFSGQNT